MLEMKKSVLNYPEKTKEVNEGNSTDKNIIIRF